MCCCNSSLSAFNLLLPKRELTFATSAAFASVLAASSFSDLISFRTLSSCRYIRFTVGYTLVMLDDLSLDVVKRKIGFPRFHTLALCLVPFGIPKLFRDSPFAAELCYRSVDCNSSHDGDNSVLFLTAVHVEQHLECASCHTRFFLVAKL